MLHHGVELRFGGEGHRIDFSALAGGRAITVYGQQEVVKDLIAARLEAGGELHFEAEVTSVDPENGVIRFGDEELRCDVIAGCDGFHGVCRAGGAGPADDLRARVSVRVARDPRARGAVLGGADLHALRPRLRAALHAHARGHAQLPPGGARRGRRRLAGRPHLGRAAAADGDRRRRLHPRRGRDLREGRHADALVRGRAAAPRADVPGRRRGAHRARRPAPRASTSRWRTSACWRAGCATSSRTATRRGSTRTPTAACSACGACSTSRGG